MKRPTITMSVREIVLYLLIVCLMWRDALPKLNTSLGAVDVVMLLITVYLFIILPDLWKKLRQHKYILEDLRRYALPVLLFVLNCVFSLLYTIDFYESFKGIVRYLLTFAMVLGIAFSLQNPKEVLRLFKLITINTVLIAILSLIESLLKTRLFPYADMSIGWQQGENSFGFYYPILFYFNTNNLAIALMINLPACIIVVDLMMKSKLFKLMLNCAMALLVMSVAILANSRGALLGTLMIFAFHYCKHLRIPNKKRIVSITLLLLVTVGIYLIEEVFSGFSNIMKHGRLLIISKSLIMFADTNFIGVGVANAELANALHIHRIRIDAIHNYWLEIMLEMGIIGFVTFGVWIFFLLGKAFSRNTLSKGTPYHFSAMLLIGFLFATIVQSSIRTADNIWIHFGFIIWFFLEDHAYQNWKQSPPDLEHCAQEMNVPIENTNNRKIGIVTLFGHSNYGNRLQNYALQETLKSLGYQAETLVYYSSYEKDLVSRAKKLLRQPFQRSIVIVRRKILSAFIGKNKVLNETQPAPNAQAARVEAFSAFAKSIETTPFTLEAKEFDQRLGEQYSAFVVGSDQVWNPYARGTEIEFLRFAEPSKRFSYAASFGINRLPLRFSPRFRASLLGMASISVREDEGAEIVRKLTGKRPMVHLDPTMLLGIEAWDAIARSPMNSIPYPYLLTYFLGHVEPGVQEMVKRVQQQEGLALRRLNDPNDEATWQAGPQDFLGYIRDARLIMTDSFHGVVFCILYQKPFYVFRRKGETSSGFSRITTLLELLGLTSRIVEQGQDFDYNTPMDYSTVNDILAGERTKALAYLKEVLHA